MASAERVDESPRVNPEGWAALVAAVGGLVTGVWAMVRSRRNDSAVADVTISEAWQKIVRDLREEMEFLRKQWGIERAEWAVTEEKLKFEMEQLRKRVADLSKEQRGQDG